MINYLRIKLNPDLSRLKKLISLGVLLLFVQGCGAPKRPVVVQPRSEPQWKVQYYRLQIPLIPAKPPAESVVFHRELQTVFQSPQFRNAFWGVRIQSLKTGEVLFNLNEDKLFLPASSMKVVTACTALDALGSKYEFETTLATEGTIRGGTLYGNLYVIGTGDPTISDRFGSGDARTFFRRWAFELDRLGIQRIQGNIIGIDGYFDRERIGEGWTWRDLPYAYATEVAALQFNENRASIVVRGVTSGRAGRITVDPPTSYIHIDNKTLVSGSGSTMNWEKEPMSNVITVRGRIGRGRSDYGTFSVHDPAAFFVHVLKETLESENIEVSGSSYVESGLKRSAKTLYVHYSPPLHEIVAVMLKQSENLYAESLLKASGKAKHNDGSFDGGRRAASGFLSRAGISSDSYVISDGSGLARYNYLTPAMLVQLFSYMKRHPEYRSFYDGLAIAGVDGTLSSRLRYTAAAGNVHAKTGTLQNVRALAGYVTTADGEMLAFAMIANNFTAPRQAAEAIQDYVLAKLAAYSKR